MGAPIWVPSVVTLDNAASTAPAGQIVMDGIIKRGWALGKKINLQSADGLVDPIFPFITQLENSADFETLHIALAIATFGIDGLTIVSDTDEFGFMMWLQRTVQGAVARSAVATDHVFANIRAGQILPSALSADQEKASITYKIEADYDGTNVPIIVGATTSNTPSLDTSTPPAVTATPERFVSGALTLNGAAFPSLESVSIAWDNTPAKSFVDGAPYCAFSTPMSRKTTIKAKVTDAGAMWKLIGTTSVPIASATHFTLLKCTKNTATRSSLAGNLKFLINAGMISMSDQSGSSGSAESAEIQIDCTASAAVAPITFSVLSA